MWRAVFILLLCSQAIPAGAEPTPVEAVPAQVVEVAPGVFVRQGVQALTNADNVGGIANIGFIVGEDAVAVVDSGGSRLDGLRLRAAIAARTDLPVRYVIITHVHPDHHFGSGAFVGENPIFVGHRRLPRALGARGGHYLEANRRLMGAEAFAGTEIVVPTVLVDDSLTLDLGQRRLTLTAYPTAHTDNDLSVLDERTGTLWTGDLLFVGHLPVIDGSLKGWLRVIDTLAAMPAARAVPGHGPASVPWPEALAPQRAYLSGLAEDLRRLIAAGESIQRASETAGRSQRDRWLLFDEFNPRNATAGFAELERE
jgi:quinoprotein relay system zinc metallohydrolase 2